MRKTFPKSWEFCRKVFNYIRRLILDIKKSTRLNDPIHSFIFFFLVRRVRPRYTMVKIERLRQLYDISRELRKDGIEGDIVECGTYNGGSAAIMAYPHKKRDIHVWVFDSFEGLPPPGKYESKQAHEQYYVGWCKGDEHLVKEVFDKISFPQERLHIVKGWFDETLPSVDIPRISLLHIDADFYGSVKVCLEKFYPFVVSGGYIVFDDYGSSRFGCKKAVDEYFQKKNITPSFMTIDGLGYFFKKELPSRR